MIAVCWGWPSRGHASVSIVLAVLLLGLFMWRAEAQESVAEGRTRQGDLLAIAGQLEDIRDMLRRLEAMIARVVEEQARLDTAIASLNEQARLAAAVEQARLDAAVAALNQQAQLTAAVGKAQLDVALAGPIGRPVARTGRAEAPQRSERDVGAPLSSALEIEVLGGVSGDELAAIVAWIREVRTRYRSSRIVVEPIMPLDSADPDGQRRRLMSEAGRVIDHVFDELNQRVDIVSMVSESVPGPKLRLAQARN